MKRDLIVTVGGTGQLVLHYYAQLFLLGAIREPFDAVVIDSDEIMGSIENLAEFFDHSRRTSSPLPAPRITYVGAKNVVNGKLREVLTGSNLRAGFNAAEAYFDSASLEQDMRLGLYARPALSAVIGVAENQLPENYSNYDRVLVIGSLIGGTGGGLVGWVLNIINAAIKSSASDSSLRALFFGEFFLPNIAQMPDANVRFPSNKLMVAKTLEQLAPKDLKHYMFIEPDVRVERDAGRQREGSYLEWPGAGHPLNTGVSSAYRLLRETTAPASTEFLEKELPPATDDELWSTATTFLRERVSTVRTIREKKVLQIIAREPYVKQTWGAELPGLVVDAYWNAQRNKSLNLGGVKAFSDGLSRSYSELSSRLEKVFPNRQAPVASIAQIRESQWGTIEDFPPDVISSEANVYSVTAANLLFRAMRGNR